MVLPLGAHLYVRTTPHPASRNGVIAAVIQAAAFIMLWSVSLVCCQQDLLPSGIVLYGTATAAFLARWRVYAWLPAAGLWAWYGVTIANCDCAQPALWAVPYGLIPLTIAYQARETYKQSSA